MNDSLWTVDAHCHLSDSRVFATSGEAIARLRGERILGFQLGGVEPEEWERQAQLAALYPGKVWRSYGLHPYFVARSDSTPLEEAFARLEQLAPDVEALGEMGLDYRRQFPDTGWPDQRQYFTRQLELAQKLSKPVVLHVVRAHPEALAILAPFHLTGMVHAFSAGFAVATRYLDLGHQISIGARLLGPDAHALEETAQRSPLTRLLIESDSPDQPPPGQLSHDSRTIWTIAARIAELKKLSLTAVVEQTRANFFALIHRELKP